LWGRRAERAALDRLIDDVRSGRGATVVVRGEAGVGKSALLDYAAEAAEGCRVARVTGAASETGLDAAGLHQLCAPLLDRLDRLPAPQRDALGTAFGLRLGPAPERFLVALAVLNLVTEAARDRPLVCLVDDAQWLDPATAHALAFVARRVWTTPAALVFAVGDAGRPELAGLPELRLGGLRHGDAHALLGAAIDGPFDERVRERIVAETRGNPLALLELPRRATPAQLAGGFGLPEALGPAAGRVDADLSPTLAALPRATRRLLLIAAAEPLGEPVLVLAAAQRLGLGAEAAAPALAAGLLELGARVRFGHPLSRATVYRAATAEQRRDAHRALAEVTDAQLDPDRRAWHRAHATRGHDEDVAAALEHAAERAHARGGRGAAAAFLERAAALTPDPARRAARALAAAQAKHDAGALDAALELLAPAEAGPLDALGQAQVELLRARIVAARCGGDVAPLLLDVATRLEALDVGLAREAHLEALWARLGDGRPGGGRELQGAARAARAVPAAARRRRVPDALLDGLALLIDEGLVAAAPTLRRALAACRGAELTTGEELRWLHVACRVAAELWDDEAWHALAARQVDLARADGALAVLPAALDALIGARLCTGAVSAASALVGELRAIIETTGCWVAPYGALAVAAWQGREAETAALMASIVDEAVRGGASPTQPASDWAGAVLANGVGRYEDALSAAHRAGAPPGCSRALPELIEAAVRCGRPEPAADALRRLTAIAHASGTDWALGVASRSRALLSEGATADALYRGAIARLRRTRVRSELARAHLLYGEWLRRERRRIDARDHLRTAHEMFLAMGMAAFAARAARELSASGQTARSASDRIGGGASPLTPQEEQIARLARDGLSNPQIASRLFISRRTVEHHLRRVFMKLDISSRDALIAALATDPASLT
jgi:DNA-binding CsgD family transcriptional regulator